MKYLLLLSMGISLAVSGATAQQPIPTPGTYDKPATVLTAPVPDYPTEARNYIYGDTVTATVTVDTAGYVISVWTFGPFVPCSNLKDPVAEKISKEVIRVTKATTFAPMTLNGQPVEATFAVNYKLPKPPPDPNFKPDKRSGRVVNGHLISVPKVKLPKEAKNKGLTGRFTVEFEIGEDGRIIAGRPKAGDAIFRQSALEAACGAVYTPTLLAGEPVKVMGSLTFNFVP